MCGLEDDTLLALGLELVLFRRSDVRGDIDERVLLLACALVLTERLGSLDEPDCAEYLDKVDAGECEALEVEEGALVWVELLTERLEVSDVLLLVPDFLRPECELGTSRDVDRVCDFPSLVVSNPSAVPRRIRGAASPRCRCMSASATPHASKSVTHDASGSKSIAASYGGSRYIRSQSCTQEVSPRLTHRECTVLHARYIFAADMQIIGPCILRWHTNIRWSGRHSLRLWSCAL